MSEMVERVARAMLAEELRRRNEASGRGIATTDHIPHWKSHVPMARVAIMAMREPTDEMWESAPVINDTNDWGAKEVWLAMIDAALK